MNGSSRGESIDNTQPWLHLSKAISLEWHRNDFAPRTLYSVARKTLNSQTCKYFMICMIIDTFVVDGGEYTHHMPKRCYILEGSQWRRPLLPNGRSRGGIYEEGKYFPKSEIYSTSSKQLTEVDKVHIITQNETQLPTL